VREARARSRRAAPEAPKEAGVPLIAAYIDPGDGLLTCGFADGRVLRVAVDQLGLAGGSPVVIASVDEWGDGIEFLREDGTRTDCAADLVEYVTRVGARAAARARAESSRRIGSRVAKQLREFRRRMRWPQREMAERLGVAVPNYARLEKGRHSPSVDTLLRIAAVIGKPLADIL